MHQSDRGSDVHWSSVSRQQILVLQGVVISLLAITMGKHTSLLVFACTPVALVYELYMLEHATGFRQVSTQVGCTKDIST